jgi:hypothetical protein
MCVAWLHQLRLFCACFVFGVVHEDLARHVCEGGVETSSDEDASIVQTNGHWVRLERQILRDLLLGPEILIEVVLEYEILVIGVSKEVDLWIWFELVVEVFVSIAIAELDHRILESPNALEHGIDDYGGYHVKYLRWGFSPIVHYLNWWNGES